MKSKIRSFNWKSFRLATKVASAPLVMAGLFVGLGTGQASASTGTPALVYGQWGAGFTPGLPSATDQTNADGVTLTGAFNTGKPSQVNLFGNTWTAIPYTITNNLSQPVTLWQGLQLNVGMFGLVTPSPGFFPSSYTLGSCGGVTGGGGTFYQPPSYVLGAGESCSSVIYMSGENDMYSHTGYGANTFIALAYLRWTVGANTQSISSPPNGQTIYSTTIAFPMQVTAPGNTNPPLVANNTTLQNTAIGGLPYVGTNVYSQVNTIFNTSPLEFWAKIEGGVIGTASSPITGSNPFPSITMNLASLSGAGTGTASGPSCSLGLSSGSVIGMASNGNGGYWIANRSGQVSDCGTAKNLGSVTSSVSNIVGIASTPDGNGYWLVGSDGGVFTFGDAKFYGSMGGTHLNQPVVGMAADPATGGYWLVASDGGVFSFNAPFFGSTGNLKLNQPIVGMEASPTGAGYRFVASDGGVFDFGDAKFYGSMGGTHLNQPVVGMAADPATGGYWLVASDGGVFSFNAPFFGSTGNLKLNQPIVGMEASPTGAGYRFVASDGGVFDFGSETFKGSAV